MRMTVATIKVTHKYCTVSEYVLFLTPNTLFTWLKLHSFFTHLTTTCCDTDNEPTYVYVHERKFCYGESNTKDRTIRNILRAVPNTLRKKKMRASKLRAWNAVQFLDATAFNYRTGNIYIQFWNFGTSYSLLKTSPTAYGSVSMHIKTSERRTIALHMLIKTPLLHNWPFKAQWFLYVPDLTLKIPVSCPQCICVFCINLERAFTSLHDHDRFS